MPGEAALNALLRGLEDPDALVRGRAMDSLAVRFEVDDLRRDVHGSVLVESPLKTLEALLLSELAPVWQHAAWQARTTFQALAAGVSPEALCLRYVPTAPAGFRERVASAFFHDEQPFDVAPIKATYGADRRWAESFLVLQLDPAVRSARAVGAIADLAADWLRPALEASAAGLTEGDGYVHAVDAALTRLAA